MERNIIKSTTMVGKVGNPEDYINLPVTRNGVAIGTIRECVEKDDKYELTMYLWLHVGMGIIGNRPEEIIFG